MHAPRVHVPTAAVSRAARDRTFTVLGFSKSHALEGLRVGAVVAPTPESLARVLSATGTDTTANGCSVLSQTAAVAAMTSCGDPDHGWLGAWRRHLAAAVHHTVSRLNAMPKVSASLPEACFVVWADVSALLYAPGDETSPPREATSRLPQGRLRGRRHPRPRRLLRPQLCITSASPSPPRSLDRASTASTPAPSLAQH